MKVHLNQIPDEGLHLEGEESAELLDLQDPRAVPTSPLRYSLDVGISQGGIFATGSLQISFDLECVACLERFPFELTIDPFAMQEELTGPETVDLTPMLREDTLLALPPYPRCDWDGKRSCPGLRHEVGPVSDPEIPGNNPPDTWAALDKLNVKPKN